MALLNAGSMAPWGGPVLLQQVFENSVAFTEADSLNMDTDGFLSPCAASEAVWGHLVAIVTLEGVGVTNNGTAGTQFTGTYTTASDNETVAQVSGVADVSQLTLYKCDPAAGTFGTTTAGSDQAGTYFDLSDEESIDETSVADTTAQYHSHGKLSTNHILANIFESSVFTAV